MHEDTGEEEKMKMITWTRPKLERFKVEYAKHKDTPEGVFVFEGNEFVVAYARYLIEYLEYNIKERSKGVRFT